jgi:hypothetical protein
MNVNICQCPETYFKILFVSSSPVLLIVEAPENSHRGNPRNVVWTVAMLVIANSGKLMTLNLLTSFVQTRGVLHRMLKAEWKVARCDPRTRREVDGE